MLICYLNCDFFKSIISVILFVCFWILQIMIKIKRYFHSSKRLIHIFFTKIFPLFLCVDLFIFKRWVTFLWNNQDTTTVYEIITIQKCRYLMKHNNNVDSSKKNLHNLDKKNRKKYRIIKTNKFTIKMVNSNKLQWFRNMTVENINTDVLQYIMLSRSTTYKS